MNSKVILEKLKALWQKIKTSKKARYIGIPVAAVVLILVGYLIYAAAYSDILPNVCVEGVNVGGMSSREALDTINKSFASSVDNRYVTVKCNDSSKTVLLSDLGVKIDPETTVANALAVGREKGFMTKSFKLLVSAFAKTDVSLVLSENSGVYTAIIDELSAPYTTAVKNTAYHTEGDTLVITKGTAGMVVNRDKALAQLADVVGNKSLNEIVLVPEYAAPKDVDVDQFYQLLTAPPRDAYYKYENNTVTVVDEVPGIIVEKQEITKAFESDDDVIRIPVKFNQPGKTAAQLKQLLFRDKLGSYSSSFATSSESRAENVRLAASRINNYVLMPGDVFSYDKTIGSRTAANGYKMAGVYVGNKTESGIGGGICQTSSTLYAAVLYSNLEIVSRTSHSLPVSYVPEGMDATIAEGYIDFQFRNNTEYPVKIVTIIEGRKLTCEIHGVQTPGQTVEIVSSRTGSLAPKTVRTYNQNIPAGYRRVLSNGTWGFTVATSRIVKMNGQVTKTEKLTGSIYKAKDIEEEINPADKDTPSSALTIFDPKNPPKIETPPTTDASTDTPPVTDGTDEPSSPDGTTDAPVSNAPTDPSLPDGTTDETVTDEPVTSEPVTGEPPVDGSVTDNPETQTPAEPSSSETQPVIPDTTPESETSEDLPVIEVIPVD